MSILELFRSRHDWQRAYDGPRGTLPPEVCRYCGAERTKANEREACPARKEGAR